MLLISFVLRTLPIVLYCKETKSLVNKSPPTLKFDESKLSFPRFDLLRLSTSLS